MGISSVLMILCSSTDVLPDVSEHTDGQAFSNFWTSGGCFVIIGYESVVDGLFSSMGRARIRLIGEDLACADVVAASEGENG